MKVTFDENGVRHLTDELQVPPNDGGSSVLSASSKIIVQTVEEGMRARGAQGRRT